jgi:3-oxoacyl-[acyl-carrier protein] reductase
MARYPGKVVLTTGCGAGIGRAYAHRFAAEGTSVVVTDRDAAAAERVVGELSGQGAAAMAVPMDVTVPRAVEAAVVAATDRFGGLDLLVNNAGIHLQHAQLPFTLEALPRWREVPDVNVLGVLACSAAGRPAMAGREGRRSSTTPRWPRTWTAAPRGYRSWH